MYCALNVVALYQHKGRKTVKKDYSPCRSGLGFFSSYDAEVCDKLFLFGTKEYIFGSLFSPGGWPSCIKMEKWGAPAMKFEMLLRGYLRYVMSAICESSQVANPLGSAG